MQNIIRKVYLSIMVSILCMITLVTVTFAWVGFLDFSSFEKFEINLKSIELEEYGIEISLTGEKGTFGSSVNQTQLKRNILCNYNSKYSDFSDEEINKTFGNIKLDQCSVNPNADNSFPDFLDMNNKKTNKYFKFDIYISAFQTYEGDNSDYYIDAYLVGNLLEGKIATRNLINGFTYPSNFINNVSNGITANQYVKNNISVDSSSACRVAIQKYAVVDKYDLYAYTNNNIINDYVIYQGGTAMPTYNSKKDLYSFGGILKDDYNLALYDFNNKTNKRYSVPNWALNRNDYEFNADTNQIINSSNDEEKIGINQMMKMTIYFWFEGWDADCFDVIDRNPVTLNLNFSLSQ